MLRNTAIPVTSSRTGFRALAVGDSLSLHTVEVSGNVGPYKRPDSSFGEGILSTSGSSPPSSGFVAISKNVL